MGVRNERVPRRGLDMWFGFVKRGHMAHRNLSGGVLARAVFVSGLIVLGSLLGVEYMPTASSITVVETMIPLDGERVQEASPAFGDFDGDGDQEIVIGGQDGKVYVVAYQGGTWSVVWQRQTADDLRAAGAPTASPCVYDRSDIRASPAVGDLDGDGRLEIVLATGGDPANHRNGGVVVYTYRGAWSFSLVPGWPQPRLDKVGTNVPDKGAFSDNCWDGIWSTPALADLDGDGDLEIVVLGHDRHIHAWHHDGSAVDGWPIYRYVDETDQVEGTDCLLRGGWSSPAVGDIDNDGLPEVVVGTDSPLWNCPGNWDTIDYARATVWAINGDGSNVPGWPVTTDQFVQSSPALGDIDGDGQLEVVVGTGEGLPGSGRHVYAWNGDGTPVSGWPRPTDGLVPASPALGDLDGDGTLEIVVGCGAAQDPDCDRLYAWHGDGSSVSGFPLRPPNNSWPGDPARALPYAPVMADYDQDGVVEILITHLGSFGIAAVSGTGLSENDPALRTEYTLTSSPAVTDVDNDGKLEVVIGGASDGQGQGGALYIWDVQASEQVSLPWPMFRRDPQRSGQHPVSPRLAALSDVHLFDLTTSGGTATGVLTVRNVGGGQLEWEIQHTISRLSVVPSSGVTGDTTPVQLSVATAGLSPGWHNLGPLYVRAESNGEEVAGSPGAVDVYVFVGDPSLVYLPIVLRGH